MRWSRWHDDSVGFESFGGPVPGVTVRPLGDVTAVAWIPFDARLHDRQQGEPAYAYSVHPLEGGSVRRFGGHAFCRLFATGNVVHDVRRAIRMIDQRPDWPARLHPGWVRAAVRLSNLRLYLDADVPCGFSGDAAWRVGATPAGAGALIPGLPWRGPRHHHPGSATLGGSWAGTKAPSFGRDDDGRDYVEQGIRFRIGTTADWMGRRLTGHRAPWAFAVARFTVHPDPTGPPTVRLAWRQSTMPTTQWTDADHGWADGHDMLDIDGDAITAFIEAGSSVPGTAPSTAAHDLWKVDP